MMSVTTLVLVAACAGSPGEPSSPFLDAALAPPDVAWYVHVEDAAAIRSTIEARPLGRFFETALMEGPLEKAWATLAARAELTTPALFDRLFGRRMTLVGRDEPDGRAWAVITSIDEDFGDDILPRMRLHRHAPHGSWPIAELPESSLLVTRDAGRLVIGSAGRPSLFYEVLDRLAGESKAGLAADAIVARGRSLGGGRVGCYFRHHELMGGASAILADVKGETVEFRQFARFVTPPFDRPPTKRVWDAGPLGAFEDDAILATMEPNDIGLGPVATFLEGTLDISLIPPAIDRALGGCRILAMHELEGRELSPPSDQLIPTASVAIQIAARDAETSGRLRSQVDEHVRQMTLHVERASGRTLVREWPGAFAPGTPRHVALAPLETVSVVPLETLSINWAVADGADGQMYWIVATHPEQLERTVAAIREPVPPTAPGQWTNVGTADGRRAARHLRGLLAPWTSGEHVDPEAARDLSATVELFANLADGLDRCRWRLARPAAGEMELLIQATLSPPDSADR